ncbi:hypothetical protein ACI2KR_31900, partial [Pseudomonas luteola]
RRRSSASWKNSAGGIGVFHQIREVFFRPSLGVTLSDRSGHSWNLLSDRTACEVLNADDPLTATPLTQAEITEARRLLISLLHDRYLDILTGTKYEDAIVADTLPRRY